MYRFAFDLGSGSLGWAVYRLNRAKHICGLVDLGTRIFPTGRDPKSKESTAAGRRQPRQQRRQYDRRIDRRTRLAGHLVKFGLMPPSERDGFFAIDPYEARDRTARGKADLYDIGRAIWHMSKHRGFKSNRQADRGKEDESGKIASASATLRKKLVDEGFATYGAWLASRHAKKKLVRVRPQATNGGGETYEFYPQRAMLEAEFDFIWDIQAQHHSVLTNAAKADIRDAIFFQRPLKPVKPGRCTFFPEDPRLPKWHPLAQEFLILQQLNMLRLRDGQREQSLDLTTRNDLLARLMRDEKLTWVRLRNLLKLHRSTEINLETGGLKKLASNQLAARFAATLKEQKPLADCWRGTGKAAELLLRMLTILDEEASPERAIDRLVAEIHLPRDVAERIEKIPLPDGHLMLGERATRAIVQKFSEEVIVYPDAVKRASEAGLFGEGIERHHSDLRGEGDGLDLLPAYNRLPELQRMIGAGTNDPNDPDDIRYGRISNPTVHIALNQFRRVMNALIATYGKPAQVVLENTRDMAKSARELKEIKKNIEDNTKRNDRWRAELKEEGVLVEGAKTGDRLLRMRLWEELGKDRLCPYSGNPIPLHKLFSDEVEIDHILPFEDTFEDSPGNKTVCYRKANRIKGKRGPGDAWSGGELDDILARVKAAPGMRQKLWRFLPGALAHWQSRRGFEDRQLHATGHLAKIVRAYAEALFPRDGTSNVWVLPGQMTAMLRRRWGLYLPDHNAKTRNDHRHHALDAATVGGIDRRMIQELQTHAREMGAQTLDRLLPNAPEPYKGFSDEVRLRIASVVVSHRPDHSPSGKLHEDTAYGEVRDVPENQAARTIGNLVRRKPVVDLTRTEIGKVRDEKIRQELEEATKPFWEDKRALKIELEAWSDRTGHCRLRILTNNESARPIYARSGKPGEGEPYKWMIPGENLFLDILEGPDGKWFRYGVDRWSKASGSDVPWQEAHPDARFVMRLFKGDTIQLFDWDDKEKSIIPGTNQIKKITSIPNSDTNNYVTLAGVNEAGNLMARHEDPKDDFRWDWPVFDRLRLRRARRVRIDELGRVRTVPHGVI